MFDEQARSTLVSGLMVRSAYNRIGSIPRDTYSGVARALYRVFLRTLEPEDAGPEDRGRSLRKHEFQVANEREK